MKPTIESPTHQDRTDVDLARRVKAFLDSKRSCFRRVDVVVAAGTVKLSGPVNSFFLRQIATALVSHVAGVRRVDDCLEVTDEATPSSSAGEA